MSQGLTSARSSFRLRGGPPGMDGVDGAPGATGATGATGPAGPAPAGTGLVHVTGGVVDTPGTLPDTTEDNATSSRHGLVPKTPGDATKFLNGAATAAFAQVKDADLAVSDVTTNNVSTTQHGFQKKLSGNAYDVALGDGNYDELDQFSTTAARISGVDAYGDVLYRKSVKLDSGTSPTAQTWMNTSATNAAHGISSIKRLHRVWGTWRQTSAGAFSNGGSIPYVTSGPTVVGAVVDGTNISSRSNASLGLNSTTELVLHIEYSVP